MTPGMDVWTVAGRAVKGLATWFGEIGFVRAYVRATTIASS
jgi:hypothetical protein